MTETNMKTCPFCGWTINDGIGHLGLRYVNLIAARLPDGRQVIFEFSGKSVPGFVNVIREYHGNGYRWSRSTWTVELSDDAIDFTRSQDMETWRWLNSNSWDEAIAEFTGDESLDRDAVERFIRSAWKNVADLLDNAEADSSEEIAELTESREELESYIARFGYQNEIARDQDARSVP